MRGKSKWQQYMRNKISKNSYHNPKMLLAKVLHAHVIASVMLEVQSWTEEFEVTLWDQNTVLYHDFLKARSQEHASEVALKFAQTFFPACNRIHIDCLEARCQ